LYKFTSPIFDLAYSYELDYFFYGSICNIFNKTGPQRRVDCMAPPSLFHSKWWNPIKCLSQG